MKPGISRQLLANRVASELGPGQVVNLGVGLPGMVSDYVAAGMGVIFHAENGLINHGPRPQGENWDSDLVDAGGEPVGLLPGGSVVHQADSLGMVRGGYVDVAVVEALQVSERGDLADRAAAWGVAGGSVDVAAGAKRLIAMMEHTTQDGSPRVVADLGYPSSGSVCVDLIVTDVAVIQVSTDGLLLKEVAPGWSVEEVQDITGATLIPSPDLKAIAPSRPVGQADSKVYSDAASAVADIPDGSTILLDGFAGPGGMAQYLILALRDQGARELTIVSNTAGIARAVSFGTPPGFLPIDHSVLVDSGQVRKAVASFPVSPSPSRPSAFELAYRRGEVDLELVPQGTLAERIRAGGFGIAAFYTPTGAGTQIAEGKETRLINGREQVLEYGIVGDYALLRAHKADTMGNLVYRGTSRNFNAVMAPTAAVTIVEVDEIVPAGQLDPDAVVTPGVFVQRIVQRPAGFFPYERTV